jgi:hypothetical protein
MSSTSHPSPDLGALQPTDFGVRVDHANPANSAPQQPLATTSPNIPSFLNGKISHYGIATLIAAMTIGLLAYCRKYTAFEERMCSYFLSDLRRLIYGVFLTSYLVPTAGRPLPCHDGPPTSELGGPLPGGQPASPAFQ